MLSRTSWKIGRILQFAYYNEKKKSSQQYRGNSVELDKLKKDVGVLCTWFKVTSLPREFSVVQTNSDETHTYLPLSSYVCTLSYGCLENVEAVGGASASIVSIDSMKVTLLTAVVFAVTIDAFEFVENKFKLKVDGSTGNSYAEAIAVIEATPIPTAECWTKHGDVILHRKHLQQIFGNKELSDLHIHAFQIILKKQFPNLAGLQNTLYQRKKPLQYNPMQMVLQVLNVGRCHWAVLQVHGTQVCLYDSAYSSAGKDTLQLIAQLIRTREQTIRVCVMNVAKQSGTVDCGLYALANLTCLAMDIDPVSMVYDQDELRPHLAKVLEYGAVNPFPTKKHRRPSNRVCKIEEFKVYCRLPDDGKEMIGCDNCQDWFHYACLGDTDVSSSNDNWFCDKCTVNH